MEESNYVERFIKEYRQLEGRIERLESFIIRIEEAKRDGTPEPEHGSPVELLRKQWKSMTEYKMYLKERSLYEGIEL